MTKPELFKLASGDDPDAMVFLTRLEQHMADVGHFVVSSSKDAHQFISLMARTNTVFSLPFYVRNAPHLHLPVLKALNLLPNSDALPVAMDVAFLKLGFADARKLIASTLANTEEKG